jgi:hypothetical protein
MGQQIVFSCSLRLSIEWVYGLPWILSFMDPKLKAATCQTPTTVPGSGCSAARMARSLCVFLMIPISAPWLAAITPSRLIPITVTHVGQMLH